MPIIFFVKIKSIPLKFDAQKTVGPNELALVALRCSDREQPCSHRLVLEHRTTRLLVVERELRSQSRQEEKAPQDQLTIQMSQIARLVSYFSFSYLASDYWEIWATKSPMTPQHHSFLLYVERLA